MFNLLQQRIVHLVKIGHTDLACISPKRSLGAFAHAACRDKSEARGGGPGRVPRATERLATLQQLRSFGTPLQRHLPAWATHLLPFRRDLIGAEACDIEGAERTSIEPSADGLIDMKRDEAVLDGAG